MPDIPTGSLVGAAAKAVSGWRPWAVVKRHDRLVRHEYDDLMTFANDELQAEGRNLGAVKNDLAGRGLLHSGAFGVALMGVRNESAKNWRDFKRTSDRKIEEMSEAEGFAVRAWRAIFRKPWPVDPDADELRGLTRAWEDEAVRREAVEREVAPQVHAEREKAVWFFAEEKIREVDQAAAYRGQIGNRGPETALGVTAQMVAETREPCAESVLIGDLVAEGRTQREFLVMTPHPRLHCLLSWRDKSGEKFSYATGQVFEANPIA